VAKFAACGGSADAGKRTMGLHFAVLRDDWGNTWIITIKRWYVGQISAVVVDDVTESHLNGFLCIVVEVNVVCVMYP
jgi:hypothetical protein